MLYSIPSAYFADVIYRLADSHPGKQPAELLPRIWDRQALKLAA